jgi:transposase
MEFKRIAIDTSKHVFTLHGVDHGDHAVLRRELKRTQLEAFFRVLPPTDVALEACGGSHHWGRLLSSLGHTVKLIPPQYVKPFVKRGKNDRNDAEAINEAASRPTMRFVPVKSAERQAATLILKTRDLLVRQRTQLINAVRGHAVEFGVIAAKGTARIEALLERVAGDAGLPVEAREMIAVLGEQTRDLDIRITALEARMKRTHKANPVSRLLETIPGVGPIGALSLALTIDPGQFRSGRHFAAWLGLTPRERSTGGKQRMGGISRAGDERLRQLLVIGATAVIRFVKPGGANASVWLLRLLERRPRKVAAVALANKMARVVWAMMTSGEAYRAARSVPIVG